MFGQLLYHLCTAGFPHEGHICVFLFFGVGADRLAKLLLGAQHIQHIVPNLERHPDRGAILRCGFPLGFGSAGGGAISFSSGSAVIADSCTIGEGVIIYPFALVSDNAVIGDGCIVNMYSSITHDVVLGEYCTISGHCDVTGMCRLGDRVFMGTTSHVVPGSRIPIFTRRLTLPAPTAQQARTVKISKRRTGTA